MESLPIRIWVTALFLATTTFVFGQRATISGYVRDQSSGEELIGATISLENTTTGTATNAYGFYSFSLVPGKYVVLFSYIGYEARAMEIDLQADLVLNVELNPRERALSEIVISETRAKTRENVEKPQMGVMEIPVSQIKEIPALLGEKDLLKSLQLLPGVQSGSEAFAGFYVRGGGPDQNLILLDEAVVYNPFHLAGFLSVFNLDAIKNMTLYKGGFPAQYGGRLSSILDIKMKEGNMKKWEGEGGIGLITSRLTFGGPIIKDKASFMLSGRFFYLSYLMLGLTPKSIRQNMPRYTFYDLNAKVNYKISDKDRIFISGYQGDDLVKISVPDDSVSFSIPWGNRTLTARWNHIFNNRIFSNTSFIFNDYEFAFNSTVGKVDFKLLSGIRDYSAKTDIDFFPAPGHQIKFGAAYTYHIFTPGTVRGSVDTTIFESINRRYTHESAVYASTENVLTDRISTTIGFRLPFFVYKNTTYVGYEPRLTAKYSFNRDMSFKIGYTRMFQFIHLLTNSTATTPMDMWVPSSNLIKPQVADQVAAGVFRNFFNDTYEASVEVYYKNMQNQIEYKEGSNIFFNNNLDEILVFGRGWSYGGEFFLQKREGRLTGWVGYTLSWTNRKFPDLNAGRVYPAKYDRRHDLSAIAIYDLNKNWSVSAVFVYGTGHSITLPEGRFFVPWPDWVGQENWYSDYGERNGYKLRSYNRLDLGIKRTKDRGKFITELRIDIYNVYSRRNPYFVYLTQIRDDKTNSDKFVAKQVSLLPMIPSVSYNFKF